MNIDTINRLMDEINSDRTVPKNIRNLVEESKKRLNDKSQEASVRISSAVLLLDEVSNDQNIPTYTRTQIWNIVSLLEVMNEKLKEESG